MWFHGIFALCGRNTRGTYGYPYYFHRGEVLTSRPTLVEKLLLFPWLVYQEYPPGAGRSTIHSAFHSFWCVWVSESCMWLWCEHKSAHGKYSVVAACAFGAIPRLSGPPHSLRVRSCGNRKPVQGPLMLSLQTASSRAWRSQSDRRGACARQAHL